MEMGKYPQNSPQFRKLCITISLILLWILPKVPPIPLNIWPIALKPFQGLITHFDSLSCAGGILKNKVSIFEKCFLASTMHSFFGSTKTRSETTQWIKSFLMILNCFIFMYSWAYLPKWNVFVAHRLFLLSWAKFISFFEFAQKIKHTSIRSYLFLGSNAIGNETTQRTKSFLMIVKCFISMYSWPRGYKTLFMINSTEHKISTHKN